MLTFSHEGAKIGLVNTRSKEMRIGRDLIILTFNLVELMVSITHISKCLMFSHANIVGFKREFPRCHKLKWH
jgi:hypothetical protein